MTDDWLREIDDTMIVGAVLLDFSAAFDIIEITVCCWKNVCVMALHPLLYYWSEVWGHLEMSLFLKEKQFFLSI